jgi:membrane protein
MAIDALRLRLEQSGQRLWGRLPPRLREGLHTGWLGIRLWIAQDAAELGASIAFYSMFGLAPLLVVAISVASGVFGAEAARGEIVGQIEDMVGRDAAVAIQEMIASAWNSDSGGFAAALGIVTLLFAASRVFAALRTALNRIGRVVPHASALTTFVRAKLVAIALVLGFGFLLVASLALSAALAAFTSALVRQAPMLAGVLSLLDVVVSTAVLTAAFAAFLRWLPDAPPHWRAVWIGALVSALLFSIGKHFIGLYLGRVSATNSYGAAGSFAIIMLWIYYSSQILLLGAAVTWAIEGVQAEDTQAVALRADALEAERRGEVPPAGGVTTPVR